MIPFLIPQLLYCAFLLLLGVRPSGPQTLSSCLTHSSVHISVVYHHWAPLQYAFMITETRSSNTFFLQILFVTFTVSSGLSQNLIRVTSTEFYSYAQLLYIKSLQVLATMGLSIAFIFTDNLFPVFSACYSVKIYFCFFEDKVSLLTQASLNIRQYYCLSLSGAYL